jgi:hypothetical protein
VTAIATPDTRKAIVQDAAIKITVYHLSNIRAEKTILLCKTLVLDLLKGLEMVFHALAILRSLGLARAINRRNIGLRPASP